MKLIFLDFLFLYVFNPTYTFVTSSLSIILYMYLVWKKENIKTNEAETKITYQPLHNINPHIDHKYCSLDFKA